MAHILNSYDGVVKPRLASKTDIGQLEAAAAAKEAIDNYHLQYVRNDLTGRFPFANQQKCEENKKEILNQYVFEKIRKLSLKERETLTEEVLKEKFLERCNEIFSFIWVEAILQMRKPSDPVTKGNFVPNLMTNYVRRTAQSMYGIKLR